MDGNQPSSQDSLDTATHSGIFDEILSIPDRNSISSSSIASASTFGGREGVASDSSLLLTKEEEEEVEAELGGVVGSMSSPHGSSEVDGIGHEESCDLGWGEEQVEQRTRCYSVDHVKKLSLGHTFKHNQSSWGLGFDSSDRNIGSPSSLQMWPLYEDSMDGVGEASSSSSSMRFRSMSVGAPMASRFHRTQSSSSVLEANVFSRMSVYSLRSAFEYLDKQGRGEGVV